MRIIEGLTRSKVFFDGRPNLNLTSIRKQHADDCTLFCSLFNREESLTWYPSVSNGLFVGLSLTLSNNNVETIVTQVASLTRTLDTITDHGDGFVLQYFTCFLKRELFAGDYGFHDATKIHFCHKNGNLNCYTYPYETRLFTRNSPFVAPSPPYTRERLGGN